MKLLISLLFTVLCKSGVIEEYDGHKTYLQGDKTTYYYYELEYQDGVYLYISNSKDSVWFYVIDNKAFYLNSDDKKNQEFEIIE